MKEKNRVIIIGGGASGLFAAITAAEHGAEVVVLEKEKKAGRKILKTGNGRCNFTNACDFDTLCSNVITNPKFLYGSFHDFSPQRIRGRK